MGAPALPKTGLFRGRFELHLGVNALFDNAQEDLARMGDQRKHPIVGMLSRISLFEYRHADRLTPISRPDPGVPHCNYQSMKDVNPRPVGEARWGFRLTLKPSRR